MHDCTWLLQQDRVFLVQLQLGRCVSDDSTFSTLCSYPQITENAMSTDTGFRNKF